MIPARINKHIRQRTAPPIPTSLIARAVRLSRIRANIAAMPNVSLFKW